MSLIGRRAGPVENLLLFLHGDHLEGHQLGHLLVRWSWFDWF